MSDANAVTIYYLPHRTEAMRIALALSAKAIPFAMQPLQWFDDETFFSLGIGRIAAAVAIGETIHTDTMRMLANIDTLFPDAPALRHGVMDDSAWQALCDWRQQVDAVLERLHAPIAPGFQGLGDDPDALTDFKSGIQHRFGLTLEELANDRYAGFEQFTRLSRLPELAKHLAKQRYYLGQFSIADCLLAADLYPLQMHDGIHLPIDLLYYLERVAEHSQVPLNRDWIAR